MTQLLTEIGFVIVAFLIGVCVGVYYSHRNRPRLKGEPKFGGMELVGICKGDNPSPPQRDGVYRLELFCNLCNLWNMYEGEKLPPIHGEINLGCCSSPLLSINGQKRRVNITTDRRAYFVNSAVQVFKQFNNDEK